MQVRCICNHDASESLTIGWVYTVLSECNVSYNVLDDAGESNRYFKYRFTLVEPTTLFTLPDGETVPIPETLQPLNGDYIVFKGVKYQIVSLTHDVDQGVKIYKMEIVKCK